MARRRSKTLTDGELRLMEVVWRIGPASVKQVVESLPKAQMVAYNTVQTMLGILVEKGYLSRAKEGRAFVYRAEVSRRAARAEALQHLTRQFFGGSRRDLIFDLLEDEPVDAAELEELRARLEAARDDDQADSGNNPKESS